MGYPSRIMDSPPGIKIPVDSLSAETLHHLIEELVTRDGSEFTDSTVKIAGVEAGLRRGAIEIWFDPESKSCSLHRVSD
jgi:uncharacterized protein YheU (UPF0270 family)